MKPGTRPRFMYRPAHKEVQYIIGAMWPWLSSVRPGLRHLDDDHRGGPGRKVH